MTVATDICEHLSWDSEFFGLRTARLTTNRLDRQTADRALAWCRERTVDVLYFLADLDEPETVRLAEDRGFRLVDGRVTLDRPLAVATVPPP